MKRVLTAAALFGAFLLGDWQSVIAPSSQGIALVRPAAAYDQDEAYQDFYEPLRPYGQWVVSPRWGNVWYPTGMPPGWRPYANGHWDFTNEYGWVWVSDYEWGWAPFHYGRWAFEPPYGWVWIPGRVWGPAWVSFRYGDDYVGWAPLPPDEDYGPNYGYVPSYGYEPAIAVSWW